ncbi:MAG: 5-oxoprolinase subunit C family protein [Paracoccaceae bacterium]
MTVLVDQTGPMVSVQDAGRAGGLGMGLSRGGAVDRQSYIDACALAAAPLGTAAIEMAGFGGRFRFETACRFALAGAEMRATLDGAPLEWNAAHWVDAGAVLEIGAARDAVYGYLLPGGGVATPQELGGRGYHRIAGLGRLLQPGDSLPCGPSPDLPPMRLARRSRVPDTLRVIPGPQTDLFDAETRARFEGITFTRSARANRQGVRIDQEGEGFTAGAQLSRVSDFVCEGDIQMTGDGTPYVLLADCQTMGGYPRIGTVISADLPAIAQAPPGAKLQFRFIPMDEAEALWQSDEAALAATQKALEPLVRDPHAMRDLLSYELIGKPILD